MSVSGNNKGADMQTEEEVAMSQADETGVGTPDPIADSIAAGTGPVMPLGTFEPDLFEAEPAPPRPPALHQLMRRLERRTGNRGARLAAINLRAGIAPPALRTEFRGAEAVQASLWMELARENATLRREAERLEERQHSLSRRIQRARTRVQELRLKLLQRRLGLTLWTDELNSELEPAARERGPGEAGSKED